MDSRNNPLGRLRQRALTGTALLAMFCALAAGGIWHYDTPGTEAACPVCQVAHMPVTGPVAAPVIVVSTLITLPAPAPREIRYSSPGRSRASSRAPPAEA